MNIPAGGRRGFNSRERERERADLLVELRLFQRGRGDHGDSREHTPEWHHHGDGNHTPPVGGVTEPCVWVCNNLTTTPVLIISGVITGE